MFRQKSPVSSSALLLDWADGCMHIEKSLTSSILPYPQYHLSSLLLRSATARITSWKHTCMHTHTHYTHFKPLAYILLLLHFVQNPHVLHSSCCILGCYIEQTKYCFLDSTCWLKLAEDNTLFIIWCTAFKEALIDTVFISRTIGIHHFVNFLMRFANRITDGEHWLHDGCMAQSNTWT